MQKDVRAAILYDVTEKDVTKKYFSEVYKMNKLKTAAVLIAMAAVGATFGGCSKSAGKESAWAYAAITLNSAESGIGSVYYEKDYFTTDKINPITVQAYTQSEIDVIVNGAVQGAEGYVFDIPEAATIGVSVNGTDNVYWYDATGAAAVVSHSDALILNGTSGVLSTSAGETVATPIN